MTKNQRSHIRSLSLLVLLCSTLGQPATQAANHREAPITALDTKADITDWFAFVSYDDPSKVTFLLDVDPLLEPSNGPNYFPFDPELVYEMRIDNNFDAKEDVVFQFRFRTEYRLPGVFTGFVGAGKGVNAPANSPSPIAPGTPIVPPAITALDGPGAEGLGLRQTYSVTMLRIKGDRTEEIDLTKNRPLYAVPSNVGPRTMPDYDALANQGIYRLDKGVKVFAGTVDDPFYIDLGAAFDSLNFRQAASGPGIAAVLSADQDAEDNKNFSADDVAGFNVNTIALEVPIRLLTADGRTHAAADPLAVIGTYGATLRPKVKILSKRAGKAPKLSEKLVQIQRMGNALINELLIGTGDKDRFSMSDPSADAQFKDYLLDPLLARVLNAVYGGAVSIPTPPRLDLAPLVFYAPPICPACSAKQAGPLADLLRLNTGIKATPASQRKRLGVLAGDNAGYPNGRRVSDDVTDISTRVVTGVLNPTFNVAPNNALGDGTNTNDKPYQEVFPYVAFANSGRQSRHIDPTETGCVSAVPPFKSGYCPLD